MTCPQCGRWVDGKYCNDGHPMRKARRSTDDEIDERCARIYPVHQRYLDRKRGRAALLALTTALTLSR